MAETERDFFVTGLRNAHAMEIQARELMERQIDRTQDYPELRTRLQQHLVETTSQLERLESVLKEMGESSSTLKDSLIGAILKLSRKGRRELKRERVQLSDVMMASLASLQHQIDEAGATVNMPDTLPSVVSDRLAIE
jgi:ferritin-like metal-binding protein YciE